MKEDKKGKPDVKPTIELTEADLEQVSGGTPNTTGTTTTTSTTTGVQKDKLKTANKNSEEMKKLL